MSLKKPKKLSRKYYFFNKNFQSHDMISSLPPCQLIGWLLCRMRGGRSQRLGGGRFEVKWEMNEGGGGYQPERRGRGWMRWAKSEEGEEKEEVMMKAEEVVRTVDPAYELWSWWRRLRLKSGEVEEEESSCQVGCLHGTEL